MNQALYDKIDPCTILRAETGSKLYGLNLEGGGDRDEMGVCIEPFEMAFGFSEFEQLEYRTAAEREGKHDAPSKEGDLDLKIYSLRKFLRLCLKGNPTVLELLYIPQDKWMKGDARGAGMQELAPYIAARSSGRAYLGYMQAQRERMVGERGGRHGKMDQSGGMEYDTKYATHMLRLGFQGVELLETGKIELPLPSKTRDYLLSVRRGERDRHEVLTRAGELERELKDLIDSSPLQEVPDVKFVENWMLDTYFETWRARYANPKSDLRASLGMTPFPLEKGDGRLKI